MYPGSSAAVDIDRHGVIADPFSVRGKTGAPSAIRDPSDVSAKGWYYINAATVTTRFKCDSATVRREGWSLVVGLIERQLDWVASATYLLHPDVKVPVFASVRGIRQ